MEGDLALSGECSENQSENVEKLIARSLIFHTFSNIVKVMYHIKLKMSLNVLMS